MKRTLFTLGIAVTLLAGCAAPAQTEPPSEPTVSGEETVLATESALPWVPYEEEQCSYEEYFAQIHSYDVDDGSLYLGRSWGGYSIAYGDGELKVTDVWGKVLHTVPNVDTDINWVACDDSWIYGVRNGTELLRIDYWGANEQVLYSNSAYTIGLGLEVNGEREGWAYLAEESVLFFTACSDEGSMICRLYLPDLTMDILAESDLAAITLDDVLSNHEVLWSERNPAFEELLDGMSEEELAKYPADDLWEWVSADYQIPYTIMHYDNSATDEHYALPYYGNLYSERTSENMAANGHEWWKDFQ